MTSTNQKPLRFGVIGCGTMAASVHVPNMHALPGASTVAYCDLDEPKAKALLEKFGGEYTTSDYKRLLADPTLDGVLIQIGPKAHPKFVLEAANAGKHIFVEKPLSLTLADAMACVRAVEAANVKFIVGTCNRLAPMIKLAKQLCPNPRYSVMYAGSTVTHASCHVIDLAVNLFHQAPLLRVYAQGGVYFGGDPCRPIDSFAATLSFADGSVCSYTQHFLVAPEEGKYGLKLFAPDTAVHVPNRYMACHLERKGGHKQSWRYEGQPMYRGPFGYMGHYDELENLCQSIRDNTIPAMPIRDAARQVAVEEAIIQSVQENKVVDFPAFLKEHDAEILK
jgi:predicted dehydrogenase